MRIHKTLEQIDFNFYLNMDTQTSPEMSAGSGAGGKPGLHVGARHVLLLTQAEWDASSTWSPQLDVIAADGESMTTEG